MWCQYFRPDYWQTDTSHVKVILNLALFVSPAELTTIKTTVKHSLIYFTVYHLVYCGEGWGFKRKDKSDSIKAEQTVIEFIAGRSKYRQHWL